MAVIEQEITDRYAIYNADCMEVMKLLPSDSIHFSVYSPPFGGLYHYSSDERDLSNARDFEGFLEHYAFVVRELSRITLPGRLTAVHCSDIPRSNSGGDMLRDLPGDIIRLHESNGWAGLKARHAIWKEPLWVRNRTMCKDLAHRTTVDDASNAGVASCDFLLVFQNRGTNKIPIEHLNGFTEYAGASPLPADVLRYRGWTGDQKQNRYSHEIWQRYASSVWDDIRGFMGKFEPREGFSAVLPFQDCKEPDDEKHVHPLQLDIIERAIVMRSNAGENVLTPFMGVGSEVYVALKTGRRGIGIELKPSYYRQAKENIAVALKSGFQEQSDMFNDSTASAMAEELEA